MEYFFDHYIQLLNFGVGTDDYYKKLTVILDDVYMTIIIIVMRNLI